MTVSSAIYQNKKARAIAGVAALTEMLDCIGRPSRQGDMSVAALLCEYELELRAMREVFLEEVDL